MIYEVTESNLELLIINRFMRRSKRKASILTEIKRMIILVNQQSPLPVSSLCPAKVLRNPNEVHLIQLKYILEPMKMLILTVLTLSLVSTLRIVHLQSFFDDSAFPVDLSNNETDASNITQGGISYFPTKPGASSGSDSIPVDNLTGLYQQIDQFIRQSLPELSNATLTSINVQVVAGKRYCYTYEYEIYAEDGSSLGTTENEYCVLSRPWENNYLRLTTSDGSIFVKGGVNGIIGTISAIFLGPSSVDDYAGTDATNSTDTIVDTKTI